MKQRDAVIVGVVIAVAAWGCKQPAPSAPADVPVAAAASVPDQPVVDLAAQASPVIALPSPPTLTQIEVQELVAAWLQAQNAANFPAYSMLYANKMTGIRRVGSVARQFGRSGWLQDRKRMFGKVMLVQARQIEITIGAGIAQVQFEQSFETGAFKDTGPKRWTVIRELGAARIAREEMLQSTVGAVTTAQSFDSAQLALAVSSGGRTWLVVSPNAPQSDQPPRLLARQGPAAAVRSLTWPAPVTHSAPVPSSASILHSILQWRDRDVVVYGQTGQACRGQVSEVAALVRVIPHFGQVQTWDGVGGVKASDQQVAEEIWQLGASEAVVAVAIKPYALAGNPPNCEGALWGRAANLPPPKVMARDRTKTGQLHETGLETMRSNLAYKEIQGVYAGEVEPPRALHWDQFEHSVASVVSFEGHGQRLVATFGRSGAGCGGFFGEFGAIWQAQSPTPNTYVLQLASDPKALDPRMPQAAVDVDGDGVFELVAPDQIWRRTGATWRPVLTLPVPNFDCPC